MKTFLLSAVGMVAPIAALAAAQPQPMAVAPTTVKVTAGQPARLDGICLDEKLDIPDRQHRLSLRTGGVRVTRVSDGQPVTVYSSFQESGLLVNGDGNFGLIVTAPPTTPAGVTYTIAFDTPVYFADAAIATPDFNAKFQQASDDLKVLSQRADAAAARFYLPELVDDARQHAVWMSQAEGDLELCDEVFVHITLPAALSAQAEVASELNALGLTPQAAYELLVINNNGKSLTESQITRAQRDGLHVKASKQGEESDAFRSAMAAGNGRVGNAGGGFGADDGRRAANGGAGGGGAGGTGGGGAGDGAGSAGNRPTPAASVRADTFNRDAALRVYLQPYVGACHLPSGDCVLLTRAGCARAGGSYGGDGSRCDR